MLTSIGSRLGRWPTFALAIVLGLVAIAVGIAMVLVTIMSWGGGSYLLPVSVVAVTLIASGFGLMLRAGWWLDRAR